MDAQPLAQSDIRSIIADAYAVFRRHSSPTTPLDACTRCCMPPEMELEMRSLPLAHLTARHFYEYNTAAKSTVQPAAELLYFLPRLLEFVAEEAEVHLGIELSLDRLGRCPVGSLAADETRVLDRFALAFFELAITDDSRSWLYNPLNVLLMFHIGGVDVGPLLDAWLESNDPRSTLLFVETAYWHFWPKQSFTNAFADDRPEFNELLRSWMLDPDHRWRFVEKLLRPDFINLARVEPPRGSVDFGTLIDAAFHHLAEK